MRVAAVYAAALPAAALGFVRPALLGRQLSSRSTTTSSASRACSMKVDTSGEWAGWECRFSQVSGQRMSIPEDYIPESLREWDVPVWGFEVLHSERLTTGAGNAELYRRRAQVYPETGCALDHLSLEMRAATIPLTPPDATFLELPEGNGFALIQKAPFGGSHTLELVAVSSSDAQRRVRLLATVDVAKRAITRPLTVAVERCYASFDDGALYTHGLDIKTLTETLGAKCFAEYEEAPEGVAADVHYALAYHPPLAHAVIAGADVALALRGGVTVRAASWDRMKGAYQAGGGDGGGALTWALEVTLPVQGAAAATQTIGVAFTEAGEARLLSAKGAAVAAAA
ncbi:hypothetical protein JKP88DRAFT_335589 [Tribonema minus]|uniref:Uncharacterized protein n=1 Tax=Tribonema minus TaxID=303371 RepID=A0A836C8Z5_9STRA|nr:hypothetical protein JKP88DRAFT_335589 [Tribonema minus]